MLTEFQTKEEILDLNIDMRRWAAHLRREWSHLTPEQTAVRAECADMIEGCLPVETETQMLVLAAAVEYIHDELEAQYAVRAS